MPVAFHGKDLMLSRKLLFLAATGYAAIAVVAGVAVAGHGAVSSVTTIKAVDVPPQIKINRFIQDTLRWNHDVYKVPSGGTLHIVNVAADEGPHTFTVVAKKDEPRTATQLFRCMRADVFMGVRRRAAGRRTPQWQRRQPPRRRGRSGRVRATASRGPCGC